MREKDSDRERNKENVINLDKDRARKQKDR